jgi:hypothetical protein
LQCIQGPKLYLSQAYQIALAPITGFKMNANDNFAEVENLRRTGETVGNRRLEAAKIWRQSIHSWVQIADSAAMKASKKSSAVTR